MPQRRAILGEAFELTEQACRAIGILSWTMTASQRKEPASAGRHLKSNPDGIHHQADVRFGGQRCPERLLCRVQLNSAFIARAAIVASPDERRIAPIGDSGCIVDLDTNLHAGWTTSSS